MRYGRKTIVLVISLVSGFPGSTEAEIRSVLSELQLARRIKALEHNLNSFTVAAGEREAVTVVKQMPRVEQAKQPTIAIITSQVGYRCVQNDWTG